MRLSDKLNSRHGRWVEFLQEYTYVLKYKAWAENKAVDALRACLVKGESEEVRN